MSESNYKPTGELQGDTKPMPDRGSSTGLTGHATHDEGMSIDADATNRLGGIAGATKSDPMDCCVNHGKKGGM